MEWVVRGGQWYTKARNNAALNEKALSKVAMNKAARLN